MSAPTMAAELAALTEAYRIATEEAAKHARFRYPHAGPDVAHKALRRIQNAALELEAALTASPEIVRVRVLSAMCARLRETVSGDWQPGSLLEDELYWLVREARSATKAPRERPGPRADEMRLSYCVGIALILRRHGIKITAGNKGALADAVRGVVTKATGRRLPADLRPLLRAVLRAAQDTARQR